jgi:glycopeptide antibiotics resistance protein
MLFYMVYSIIKMTITDSRTSDIVDIILTFSYILMLFGVSTSIKKSVDKIVREERMKSEFDFTIDDDSPTQSLV